LRGYIVEHWDAGGARCGGEVHIKFSKIDRDEEIGALAPDEALHRAERPEHPPERAKQFAEAHHRCRRFRVDIGYYARSPEIATPHPAALDRRVEGAERRDDFGCVFVPGEFAGAHDDFFSLAHRATIP
jgi:hypothetical protein